MAPVDAAAIVVLGIGVGGFELMRDRMRAIWSLMKRRLSYRVALLTLVVVMTPGAIVLASRLTDPGEPTATQISPVAETPDVSPASATPTPEPRGPRQAPTEWQLETRSSPELAAQYPLADLYTDDEIAYLKEIAFGIDPQILELRRPRQDSEYRGDAVMKWEDGEVGYFIFGYPPASDLAEVESVISKLDSLIPTLHFRALDLSEAELDVPLAIVFGRQNDELLGDFVDTDDWMGIGGLGVTGSGDGITIERAIVVINPDQPLGIRKRAILEEITQVLGLPNDSWWYPDSTFYQAGFPIPGLADIDEALVRLLYDPRIKPGMTMEDLERMGL